MVIGQLWPAVVFITQEQSAILLLVMSYVQAPDLLHFSLKACFALPVSCMVWLVISHILAAGQGANIPQADIRGYRC